MEPKKESTSSEGGMQPSASNVRKFNHQEGEGPMNTKNNSPMPDNAKEPAESSEERGLEEACKWLERIDMASMEATRYMNELNDSDVKGCAIKLLDPRGFRIQLHRRSHPHIETIFFSGDIGRKKPGKK